ncbi:MAG: hypothetical protein Q4G51_03700 [Dermatophilus congolensis]|nr:hypothetical protein [Dermatophilus congolensis]
MTRKRPPSVLHAVVAASAVIAVLGLSVVAGAKAPADEGPQQHLLTAFLQAVSASEQRPDQFVGMGVEVAPAPGSLHLYWAGAPAGARQAQRAANEHGVTMHVVPRKHSVRELESASRAITHHQQAIEALGYRPVSWGGVSTEEDGFIVSLRPVDATAEDPQSRSESLALVTRFIRLIALPDAQVRVTESDTDSWVLVN